MSRPASAESSAANDLSQVEAAPQAMQRGSPGDRGWKPGDAAVHAGVRLWKYNPSGKPMSTLATPEIDGKHTGKCVKPGELLRIVEERPGLGGVLFLKLEDDKGWLFDKKPKPCVGVVCVRQEEEEAEEEQPAEGCRPGPDDFNADPRADIEQLLRSLGLEAEISKSFVKGRHLPIKDPLSEFFHLTNCEVEQMVEQAAQGMASRIKEAIGNARKALAAVEQSGERGHKFTGELRGGSLRDFFGGVTGLVGQPNDDLGEGMRKEHVEKQDSNQPFTTSNYGVTTTPKTEYELVTSFPGPGGEDQRVYGTRCCSKKGISQEDTRALRPMTDYDDMQCVKAAALCRVEIIALVLYTGPMFILYNAILRGFGLCGEVADGVDLWSADGNFERQFKKVEVKKRMEEAGHMFSSTIHSLVSGVKKLQRVSTGVQGSWLYRGLGGLEVSTFLAGSGFTEKAFMSTTKNLEVALEYSGAKKGSFGAVLAMEMSEVDQGAVLTPFSQYPGEDETLWNACSYMEPLHGKEQWIVTAWGPVKLIHVKTNANGKAMTVEELQERRKLIVVNMLETLQIDISRQMDITMEDAKFQSRVQNTSRPDVVKFTQIATDSTRDVVDRYRGQDSAWFHRNDKFAEAVTSAALLPILSRSWVDVFVENTNVKRHIIDVGNWNFHDARTDLRRFRHQQLQMARCRKDAEDVKRLALTLCSMHGLVRGSDARCLDMPVVQGGSITPLVEQCYEGVLFAVRMLLEAGADVQLAEETNGTTPLHAASICGDADIVRMLLQASASVEAAEQDGYRPLHNASFQGHVDAVQLLLGARASIEAAACYGTPLHLASRGGHVGAVQALLGARASIEAKALNRVTPAMMAAKEGHDAVAKVLAEAAGM